LVLFGALSNEVFLVFICLFYTNYQIEQEERAKIDAIKEEERKKATEAIERWKENQKLQSIQEQETVREELTVSHEEGAFKDEEVDTLEKKGDSSLTEVHQKSQKPATRKQPSHNKQMANGIVNQTLCIRLSPHTAGRRNRFEVRESELWK